MSHQSLAEAKRMRIVILGSGFGGVYFLTRLLRECRKHDLDITLVSNENHFFFSPLLHDVATGGISTRHIAHPIRRMRYRDDFTFVQSPATAIDLANKTVTTGVGDIGYDRLVLALGSVTDMSGLPSGAANVFTLKALRDGLMLRNHIIGCFEQAHVEPSRERQKRLVTFVVVGGGYIGVQFVSELHDFIHGSLAKYYSKIEPVMLRVLLVQDADQVLLGMPRRVGDYTLKTLRRKGIEVWLSSRITAASAEGIVINGVETIPTGTLVWVVGTVANPLVAGLPLKRDAMGRVAVNEYLEVLGAKGVYALGDCAHFEDPATHEVAQPRAHNAVRQAWVLGDNFAAELKGKPRRPYRNPFSGGLVSLGSRNGVVNAYGIRMYGFLARMIWLVAYSSLLTSSQNRIQVVMDWFLSTVFGRDTTMLDIH